MMKTLSVKYIYYIFLLVVSHAGFGQTLITINSCDTTIMEPSLYFPEGNYIVTIKSTTNSRLAYSVEMFQSYNGNVSIFDGPGIAAPGMTTLTDIFNDPGQKFGGQTTSNTITFSFHSNGPQLNLPHFTIRIRCVETPVNKALFQPLASFAASGNIQKADYDRDGDSDLLIGGKVFRNDAYFDTLLLFERKPGLLTGWDKSIITSADFDSDGLPDIFISGNVRLNGGTYAPAAAVYRNTGSGTFQLIPQPFAAAIRGACSIVDINNDGMPDISYTGATDFFSNTSRIFKVYLNNGNMTFRDANVSLPGITGLIDGSMDWADGNEDGFQDLVINGSDGTIGSNGLNNFSRLFNFNGTAFIQQPLSFTNSSAGDISWGDINMDGRPDIMNAGLMQPELFFNNGNNNYVKVNSNIPALLYGSYKWSDYDQDLDLDVVITGSKLPLGSGSDVAVYKNNGNGQFTRVHLWEASGTTKVEWLDFNGDGRPDIVASGYYYKNMGADSFRIASFKMPVANGSIIADFDNDGKRDIFLYGNIADVDCNTGSYSTLVLGRGWKNYGVPKFTLAVDLFVTNPVIETTGFPTYYYFTWADFDSDGLLDIIVTGDNYAGTATSFVIMYKNYGNNNFHLSFNSQQTPLDPPPYYTLPRIRNVGIFDIDNDGINELLILPNIVYKRIANHWVLSSYDLSNVPGEGMYVDFADYDKDGFVDAAVSGVSGIVVLRNNGLGQLVNITTPPSGYSYGTIGTSARRQIMWDDMDNDGDPDLISSTGIFENRAGRFIFIYSQITSALHFGTADFNADGSKDIITVPFLDNAGPLKLYYGQQHSLFFNEHSMGAIAQVTSVGFNESAVSFDVDNDGDEDIVYHGRACNSGAAVLVNQGDFSAGHRSYVTVASGDWSNPAVWLGGVVPPPDAIIVINHTITISQNTTCYSITVRAPAGSITLNPGLILTITR